ncbi:RES domain-containing protein [Rhodococcus spelaei]|uniref:RES domain-containing protein n=1 Tax=Rhodococcus spelaei TaxID=2546320 RepID=A0A541BP73_9NOCA|nr:RES family NAD+ phosphorylase [Rhodococcus spelaei]TQF74116.1 RES domain-containing protein [Rhodococcus spelaei]
MDSLPARLSQATPISVTGTWQRHVPAKFAQAALDGRSAVGRWGTEDSFPVLYLGQPLDSVVVEAYRHLVDPVDNPAMASAIRPRVLVTCAVDVTEILDLRGAANRSLAQLTMAQLQSPTRDRQSYAACQNVSAAAHQLGFHGIVTPAATERGETLVLFTDILPLPEKPTVIADETWMQLPADPRRERGEDRLRIVRDPN